MHAQHNADHGDTGTEERVGKDIAMFGVFVTVLVIVTVVAGLLMD